jgi:hypothetical protein
VSAWLAAAYAVLALGFGWAITAQSGWRRRIPFIVCAPALAVALWLDRPTAAGWPTTAGIPRQAALVSAVVREPDPARADAGRIYLWLDAGTGEPRAYSLPYSRALHRAVQHALTRLERGAPVSVGRAPRRRTQAKTRTRAATSGATRSPGGVRFYRHPAVLLPPKAGERRAAR